MSADTCIDHVYTQVREARRSTAAQQQAAHLVPLWAWMHLPRKTASLIWSLLRGRSIPWVSPSRILFKECGLHINSPGLVVAMSIIASVINADGSPSLGGGGACRASSTLMAECRTFVLTFSPSCTTMILTESLTSEFASVTTAITIYHIEMNASSRKEVETHIKAHLLRVRMSPASCAHAAV